jgi:hypothetical protein
MRDEPRGDVAVQDTKSDTKPLRVTCEGVNRCILAVLNKVNQFVSYLKKSPPVATIHFEQASESYI